MANFVVFWVLVDVVLWSGGDGVEGYMVGGECLLGFGWGGWKGVCCGSVYDIVAVGNDRVWRRKSDVGGG